MIFVDYGSSERKMQNVIFGGVLRYGQDDQSGAGEEPGIAD